MRRAATDVEGSMCDALWEGNTRFHLAPHFGVHTEELTVANSPSNEALGASLRPEQSFVARYPSTVASIATPLLVLPTHHPGAGYCDSLKDRHSITGTQSQTAQLSVLVLVIHACSIVDRRPNLKSSAGMGAKFASDPHSSLLLC